MQLPTFVDAMCKVCTLHLTACAELEFPQSINESLGLLRPRGTTRGPFA